jgi:hypothetical protein
VRVESTIVSSQLDQVDEEWTYDGVVMGRLPSTHSVRVSREFRNSEVFWRAICSGLVTNGRI